MLEWLKSILGDGYTEETDKQISEEIGKNFVSRIDFNQINEIKKGLEKQIDERDRRLNELKKVDVQGLNEEIEKLQTANEEMKVKHKEEIKKMEFSHALDSAISGYKAKNTKAVRALLDVEQLALEDGKIKGLDEQIQKIKEEENYLFEEEKSVPKFADKTAGTPPDNYNAMRAALGLKTE